MRKVSNNLYRLAHRLLAMQGMTGDVDSTCPVEALQRCCEEFRPRLSELVGREGFRALLARALALAKGEFPWLHPVQVAVAGTYTGLYEVLDGKEPAEKEVAAATVLAQFLGLLDAFIGPELTRQLVRSVWPASQLGDANFGIEEDEV